MTPLHKKLGRDLWHMRGQVVAISLVIMSGVAMFISSRLLVHALVESQARYYADYRFTDMFASLKRAPLSLGEAIAALPGVGAVRTRTVCEVTLDVPNLAEPATARLVSIPEHRHTMLNDIHLRRGRYIEPRKPDEVIVSESFFTANHLELGETIGAILNGRWQRLRIVGVGLSPEYVYESRGTDMFPDNRRFGVFWMGEEAMRAAFNMEGAFNDLVLTTTPEANEEELIRSLDRMLERYGGLGAYGRTDQMSNRLLSDEIRQNRTFGTALPLIFMAVAAFLLNIVLARVVSLQRDQIAVMKAFGYEHWAIARHYIEFAFLALLPGTIVGVFVGIWLGSAVANLYKDVYHFPALRFDIVPGAIVSGLLCAVGSALLGAYAAVRRTLSLPPAEAMRPESPPQYHAGVLEQIGVQRWIPLSLRMILRGMIRQPLRTSLSIVGVASAVAIILMGRYFVDAVRNIADVQFRIVQNDDVTVSFHEPRPRRVAHDLVNLPGVLVSEPFRAAPVRLRHGHHYRRTIVMAFDTSAGLRRLIDARMHQVDLPPDGLILTTKLAEVLGVEAGDMVQVEILEGQRRQASVVVSGTVDELIGMTAYMQRGALDRLLREDGTVSGAMLAIDESLSDNLYHELKAMPAVAGVAIHSAMLKGFEDTIAQSTGVFTMMLSVFASIIAIAVVYNVARIALSERGRELASLRVLGFTQREVSVMLFGEQALLTMAAIPLGFFFGYRMSAAVSRMYQWETFRMPLVINNDSYLFALAVVVGAAVGSALLVRRRIARLDLVEVLKTRE